MNRVRPEFVARMEAEIQANECKGPWEEWDPAQGDLAHELKLHWQKLADAMHYGDRRGVAEHAADVAALAMKCDELFGSGHAVTSG